MSDNKKVIGERLKRLRETKGLKQNRVAQILGVHNSTLAKYESGEREPDNETLTRLAEIYEVTVDYLLTGDHKTKLLRATLETTSEAIVNGTVIKQTETFAERLRDGMKQKGITPEQAAEECGVKPEYIEKLMNNPDKLPGVGTLYKLADLIDVTPDYLGGYTDDPQGRSPHTPKPKELTEFLENEHVMFHGVPLTDEDKQKIENVLIGLFWESKQMNKRKKN